MNKRFHPYYLIGLVAVSFSMLFLFKINKVSFYHHYFKVIEEVETRNSQALLSDAVVLFSAQAVHQNLIQPILSLLCIASIGGLFLYSPRLQQITWPRLSPAVWQDQVYLLLPPVRAP